MKFNFKNSKNLLVKMITITEKNGCQGFDEKEVRIIQLYLEDICQYRLNENYILYEFICEDQIRYSFYLKKGNRFLRMFTNHHTLQPCPSFNIRDNTFTGKHGTKKCPVKVVQDVEYVADNYHSFYINYFIEVVVE